MSSPYDLLKITSLDLKLYKKDSSRSKIGIVINLVLAEIPKKLKPHLSFITPRLKEVEGFEDKKVKGFEVVIEGNEKIERFVKSYIPFFIMEK
jgi:hypothetical protein